MLGGAVVVDSSKGKVGSAYGTDRTPPWSFPVKRITPLLLFAVLTTGFLVAAFILFLRGGVASSYYRLPSLAAGRSAPCEEKDVEWWWWVREPSKSAWHNMSDDELLWAASFEPRATPPPPRQSTPRKVAFLFLTLGPLPLAPLWERFFNGAGAGGSGRELFSVYVHTTPGYRLVFPPSSPFHGRQVPSKGVHVAGDAVGDAERGGRGAASAGKRAARPRQRPLRPRLGVVHPLHHLPAVHAYLTRSLHSFVRVVDEPGKDGRGRYPAGLAPDVSISQWRKGWQWFELHRSLAVFVVADGRYYPRFREACLPNCYMDEHYLPTVRRQPQCHLGRLDPRRRASGEFRCRGCAGGLPGEAGGEEGEGHVYLQWAAGGDMFSVREEVRAQRAATAPQTFHQNPRVLA